MFLEQPGLGILLAVAVVVPTAACFACSETKQQVAGAADAQADAKNEGSSTRDGGGLVDGSSDASALDADRSWLTGDWDPVPGAPANCDMLVGRDPARDVTAIQWKPCASGRAGCMVQDVDYTPIVNGTTLLIMNREPVRQGPQGKPYVMFRRWYPREEDPQSPKHVMTVVQPLDGAPVFALAFPLTPGNTCAGYGGLDVGGISYSVGSSTSKYTSYWRSEWATPRTFTGVTVTDVAALGRQSTNVPNATNVLVFTVNADGTVLVDRTTGAVSVPRENGLRFAFDDPREFPGGFLARAFVADLPIVFQRNDGSFTPLLTAPPGRNVAGWAIDRTQSNTLAWVEATGLAPSTNPVLYTSPFATSAAGLVPRRVTAFDDPSGTAGGRMISAHGTVLNIVDSTRALVTRLSDGVSWAIDADPGMGFAEAIWVDNDEVWLLGGSRYSNGGIQPRGFVRYSRASLGPEISPR